MDKSYTRVSRCLAAVLGVAALVALDQLTKHLVLENLKGKPPIVIIENVFQLEYLENRGAAFGLFQDQRFFFFLSVFVISVIAVVFYLRVPLTRRF